MYLNYNILSNKRLQQKKSRHFKPMPSAGPGGAPLPFIRDEETRAILRAPERMPSGQRYSPTYKFPGDSGTAEVCEISHWSPIQKPDLEWLQTLLHLQGTSFLPPRLLDLARSNEDVKNPPSPRVEMFPSEPGKGRTLKIRLSLPRIGAITKRPGATATGAPETRERQAAIYLRNFDHDHALIFDQPNFTMLKVVCNLRNYFGMNLEQTIMLMRALFNPKVDTPWSSEGISLAWELVAEYTPWLALKDVDAIAKQKRIEVEDEVTELLARTRSGGRVNTNDFFDLLLEQSPDLLSTKTAVTSVVLEITGFQKTTSYKDGRNYKGFHLPSADERLDPTHSAGLDVMSIEVPKRPHRGATRGSFDPRADFSLPPFTNHSRRKFERFLDYLSQHGHFLNCRLPNSSYTLFSPYQTAS